MSEPTPTKEQVEAALRQVIDPEVGINVVDLGLIYAIALEGASVRVDMALTSAACPLGPYLVEEATEAIRAALPQAGTAASNGQWDCKRAGRVAGDLGLGPRLREIGGLVNVVAIVAFVAEPHQAADRSPVATDARGTYAQLVSLRLDHSAVLLVAVVGVVACGGDESDTTDAGPSVPNLGPDLAGCPAGFGTGSGTVFYVDPQNGSDEGDGSEASPWRSIQQVIDDKVDCSDEGGTKHHEGAPVQGGDTIVLLGAQGHDQDLSISGCYNDDWVTITAAELREPQVRSVHFRGSAYWRIDGLTFTHDGAGTMVRAEDHDTRGEAHHLEIYNNVFTSGDLQTVQDYTDRASTGVWLLHDPAYVTVKCNHFSKVGQAMTISGEYLDVLDNLVEYFSRDAIATGGHHNRFVGNHIYDAVVLGDGHHDDFFQSHMGANPDVSSDIQVAYNVFMNRYDATALPFDMQGPTQCLSAFEEGPKRNIRVFNNVCKTDHYHGITWADTHDSLFVNNTAIGGTKLPGLPAGSDAWPDHTWISIEGDNNVVRNNITVLNQSGGDHNLEITGAEVDQYFVDWANLDLRLAAGSPAIDTGASEAAPADDVEGKPRDATPDVGAYEYVGP